MRSPEHGWSPEHTAIPRPPPRARLPSGLRDGYANVSRLVVKSPRPPASRAEIAPCQTLDGGVRRHQAADRLASRLLSSQRDVAHVSSFRRAAVGKRPSDGRTNGCRRPVAVLFRQAGALCAARPRNDLSLRAQSVVAAMLGVWRGNSRLATRRESKPATSPVTCRHESPWAARESRLEITTRSASTGSSLAGAEGCLTSQSTRGMPLPPSFRFVTRRCGSKTCRTASVERLPSGVPCGDRSTHRPPRYGRGLRE